jgi:hypothetical protein
VTATLEFGLDTFVPVTVDDNGVPIGGDQAIRNTVEEASSPKRSGSTHSTSGSTTAPTSVQRLEREPGYFGKIEAYWRAAPPDRFPALADRKLQPPSSGGVDGSSPSEGFDVKSLHISIWCCLFWRTIRAARVQNGYALGDWRALAGTSDASRRIATHWATP